MATEMVVALLAAMRVETETEMGTGTEMETEMGMEMETEIDTATINELTRTENYCGTERTPWRLLCDIRDITHSCLATNDRLLDAARWRC